MGQQILRISPKVMQELLGLPEDCRILPDWYSGRPYFEVVVESDETPAVQEGSMPLYAYVKCTARAACLSIFVPGTNKGE